MLQMLSLFVKEVREGYSIWVVCDSRTICQANFSRKAFYHEIMDNAGYIAKGLRMILNEE